MEEKEKVIKIKIERLQDFKQHPFHVNDDKEMALLKESIKVLGILDPWFHENSDDRDRRTFYHLETVESAEEASMGIAETGNQKRPCKADSVLWRPLLLGSHQNMCRQGNLQRSTKKSRTCKLS